MERITNDHRDELKTFFTDQWGDCRMVYSHGEYNCSELEGFVALDGDDTIIGAVTFFDHGQTGIREIISLDSLIERRGIGGGLMELAENDAVSSGLKELCLVTTNDNVHALHFYQKRGYRLTGIRPDAVVSCREKKPSIPEKSTDGVAIRDEWQMKKPLPANGE
ncbi:GNAT family N-acetyltransferase [Alteribacter lacisalsi]|uniref:GNAT family N-acetyltransferase n=2 Tax=Alteribacter lacisalsi TaxID=2045244 RepID=A0A2W0HFZ8_9BACI|nr:GNAT family N-acetyltransferase [Alteribacter lacisalsi]